MHVLLVALACCGVIIPSSAIFQCQWRAIVTSVRDCGSAKNPVQANLYLSKKDRYTTVISGTLNITEDLTAPLKLVSDTFEDSNTGRKAKVFTFSYDDICKVMKTKNKFVDPMFDGSDIPRLCTVKKGVYTWRNVTYALRDTYMGFLINGKYSAEGRIYIGKREMFCMSIALEMESKRKL